MPSFLEEILNTAEGRVAQGEYVDLGDAFFSNSDFFYFIEDLENFISSRGRFPSYADGVEGKRLVDELSEYRNYRRSDAEGLYLDMRYPGWRQPNRPEEREWTLASIEVARFLDKHGRLPAYGTHGETDLAYWIHTEGIASRPAERWQRRISQHLLPKGAESLEDVPLEVLLQVRLLSLWCAKHQRTPEETGSSDIEVQLAEFMAQAGYSTDDKVRSLVSRANPFWKKPVVRGSQKAVLAQAEEVVDFVRAQTRFPRASPSPKESKLFHWLNDYRRRARTGTAYAPIAQYLDAVLPGWRKT